MPSISVTLQIDADGIAGLAAVPKQLESLVTAARNNLSSIHTGEAAGNPFSSLLGDLQSLAGQVANVPDLGPVLAPVQSLARGLPDAGFVSLSGLSRGVDDVMGVFGPVKDLVLSGKLNMTLEQGAQKAVDLVGGLLKPGDAATSVLTQLERAFDMFRVIQSWDRKTPSPAALADFLGQFLAGVPADLLEKPYAVLRRALDPLKQVLPEGAELTTWRGALQERSEFWARANARLAGPNIDWAGLETSLQGELQLLIDLRAKRDRLISASLSNLGSLDFSALDQLSAAVGTVERPVEFRLSKIMEGIRSHIEELATSLENWAPTPDELQSLVNGLSTSFRTYLEESPLGELRALLLRFHHRLMLALESLPFKDLASKVEKALLDVAKAVDVIDPDIIRKPVHEFFESIDSRIREIPLADVQHAIDSVWQSARDVFQQIRTQLANLRDTLSGLVDRVKDLSQQLQPVLDEVEKGVETIRTELDAFDLNGPASVIVDDLHKLRDTIAGIDYSKIPGPALSALHAGAQFLRGLDVAGTVNPPLNDALAGVDPTPELVKVTATLSQATANLRAIDPASVAQQLDKPADDLLKVLNEFGPEKLRGLLLNAIRPIEDALKQLDFAHLLSPATNLYAELLAKVDAVLNPDAIFAPLAELVQPVVDAIDLVRPSNLIATVTSHAGPMAEAASAAANPPEAISNAKSLLKAIPEAAESREKLFGYRPGDLLLPVIEMYRHFTQALDHVSEEVLDQAAKVFQHNLTGRLQALLPSSIGLEVESSLQVAIGEFDTTRVTQRLDRAALEYQSFVSGFTSVSAGLGNGDAAVASRIGALLGQLDPLLLMPSPAQSEGLVAASARVRAGVRLEGIQSVAPQLVALESMFPAFLRGAEAGAASLRTFLRDLDPAPVRIAVNTAFDRIGKRIVALQEPLMKGLDQLMKLVEDFVLPITPGALLALGDRLHEAVREQLLALHPDRFRDELKVVFDTVKAQLKASDPGILVDELNQQRDFLIRTLRDFVTQLQPDLSDFVKLQQDLATLKPSELLKPAVESLKPVTALIGKIDVKTVLEPLVDAIARVRAQVPDVVAEIEAALDEVLNAIPEGGGTSASVRVG